MILILELHPMAREHTDANPTETTNAHLPSWSGRRMLEGRPGSTYTFLLAQKDLILP